MSRRRLRQSSLDVYFFGTREPKAPKMDNSENVETSFLSEKEIPSQNSEQSEFDGSPTLFSDEDATTSTSVRSTLKKQHSLGPDLSSFLKTPNCSKKLQILKPSDELTCLIRVETIFRDPFESAPLPYPEKFVDKWDPDYVRLPCSKDSLYPVKNGTEEKLVNRWELIETALCSKFQSSFDVEEAILSYNGRYASSWSFQGFHKLFTEIFSLAECEKYLGTVLPKVAQLALSLPEICTQPIPLLKQGKNHTLVMSQKQASCLLANAFFCTFPRRNVEGRTKKSEYGTYPRINFSRIFANGRVNVEKLKCILHYFERIVEKAPSGTVSFHRQCLTKFPDWSQSKANLMKLHISKKGTIEDFGDGMLQVDFANKYVGGGVIGEGCVQEEIRFLISPEMMVSMLFTEVLSPNECLIMTGCERYSCYMGYADSFEWSAPFHDETPRDSWGRREIEVVAIDAKPYFRKAYLQFSPEDVVRELNKAYCGFVRIGQDPINLSAVATGNWGCGAFGGDKEIKSVIQLMAAAEAGRDVVYFTFDDEQLMNDLYSVHLLLCKRGVTVGDLFLKLREYYETVIDNWSNEDETLRTTLFQFLHSSS